MLFHFVIPHNFTHKFVIEDHGNKHWHEFLQSIHVPSWIVHLVKVNDDEVHTNEEIFCSGSAGYDGSKTATVSVPDLRPQELVSSNTTPKTLEWAGGPDMLIPNTKSFQTYGGQNAHGDTKIGKPLWLKSCQTLMNKLWTRPWDHLPESNHMFIQNLSKSKNIIITSKKNPFSNSKCNKY